MTSLLSPQRDIPTAPWPSRPGRQQGRDAEANHETIISEGYAVYNKVSIGDKIRIGERSYVVSGFFQRPDYLYMLQNESDSYKNVTTFFLAYVTDEEFEKIGFENCVYQVCYEQDNQVEFRKAVNERYHMRTYLAAQENMRIDMVKMQAEMFVMMSYLILLIMPLIGTENDRYTCGTGV